ncbi:MAG: hypothetical protein JXQ30_09175 [Spirochaetes bacterium]|nr:hypothetical protein [Spirochaetota bacterium]
MNMINLLGELAGRYWSTFVRYLKSKRRDLRWVKKNQNWLARVVESGRKACRSRSFDMLRPFFEAVRENKELGRLISIECSKVILAYKPESSSTA